MVEHDTQHLEPNDAFAELGRIVLAEHSLDSVMDTIARLTKRTVPGATDVSVTLVERGKATTVAFTGALAQEMDERQYARDHGPCLSCIDGAEAVRIKEMENEARWPDWAAQAAAAGVRSSMSLPVPLQREVSAALNVYSTDQQAFSDDDVEVATTFAAYAGVALANMHLYQAQSRLAEDLQNAMKSRAVIEQAKGILMGAKRCTAERAFDLLVGSSQRTNRKLRQVAQEIVDTGSTDL